MSPIERRALAVLLLLLAAAEGRALDAPSAEDAFAAGYAAGWLDQEH
ncbi:MAG: hypothetical protein HYW08_07695, partial [candidate division NC10 bacterium]|nr:hypothetical protein [candidate division NC10 bacterium]